MSVIGDYLNRYQLDYNLYKELASTLVEECESFLKVRGVKALVSSRVKKMDSLNGKIFRVARRRKIRRKEDLQREIADLVGVRIALYFPNDRDIVDEIINRNFKVIDKKLFPSESHNPGYKKRFSGYWATHYRIKLKGVDKDNRFYGYEAEIQVASLLMHAWAEIEHDMVYKPLNGKISNEEYAILDEINGLVLSGEIALERLKNAMEERIRGQNRFNDDDELAGYIFDNMENKNIENIGETWRLNRLLSELDANNAIELKEYLSHIRYNIGVSISDQLLDFVLFDYLIIKDNPSDHFLALLDESNKALVENDNGLKFLQGWILLEKAIYYLKEEFGQSNFAPYSDAADSLGFLLERVELKQSFCDFIVEGKQIRSSLITGSYDSSSDFIKRSNEQLYSLGKRILKSVKDESKRRDWYEQLRTIFR